jgi:sporulation protein YlmC with PRC-barrel domain
VLRSVRELEKCKVAGVEGSHLGRVKDVYFDDGTWTITHLVVSVEPWQIGQKQVLIEPEHINSVSFESGIINLALDAAAIENLPLASSVLPVCKQYASFALASPSARTFPRGLVGADPHLRSAKAVMNYRITNEAEFGGILADLVWNDENWTIRYLAIEQMIERKKLRFHILPQSVERFTWATQRVLLRALQPVLLEDGEIEALTFRVA